MALASSLSLSPGSVANGPRVPDAAAPHFEEGNAALHYLACSLRLSDVSYEELLSWWQGALDERWVNRQAFRQRFASDDSVIAEALHATRFVHSDFGVHYEDGPAALLPHLGLMRNLALILLLDARAQLDEGDDARALERVAAAYRLAEHVSQDRLLISARLAASIVQRADELSDFLDTKGSFDNHAPVLRQSLSRLSERDPLRFCRSVKFEGEVMTRWLRERAATAAGRTHIIDALALAHRNDEPAKLIREAAATSDGLNPYISLLERAYVQAVASWGSGGDALAELDRQVGQGVFGPLARELMPNLERVRAQEEAARSRLERRLARLHLSKPASNPEEER